jgi:hypothetical protein
VLDLLRPEQEVLMTSIRRLTQEQMASLGYTVAELRQLAREHDVLIPRGTLHHEVVARLTAAGVGLPPQRGSGPPGSKQKCAGKLILRRDDRPAAG